jgi:hypothetical protein
VTGPRLFVAPGRPELAGLPSSGEGVKDLRGGIQFSDRCGDIGCDYAVVVEVQPLEECIVELPSGSVRSLAVQLVRIGEQRNVCLQDTCSDAELFAGLAQPGLHPFAVDLDVSKPGMDLVLRQCCVGCQVE